MKKPIASTLIVVTLGLSLSACVVAPPYPPSGGPGVAVWAPLPPPPPRVEVVPPPPRRDYFWIPGYWLWEANRHRWVDGRWEARREREHWVPHRWEHDERGQWRANGGYWRRD